MLQRRQSHHVQWSATVDCVLPFVGMYHQARRGFLRLCRAETSEEACSVRHYCNVLSSWTTLCEICRLHALQTLLAPHSNVQTIGHTAVHLKCLACQLSLWITCRDDSLSLYVALSKLWCDNLLLTSSDGSFRFNWRVPFIGYVDCATCSKFPFAIKWVLLEMSNCQNSPELFAICTIATYVFHLSEAVDFPFLFVEDW